MSRAIHIDGIEYPYKVTKSGVRINLPNKKKPHFVDLSVLTGWSWDTLERAHWKGYWPQIKPSDVKKYILDNNLHQLSD